MVKYYEEGNSKMSIEVNDQLGQRMVSEAKFYMGYNPIGTMTSKHMNLGISLSSV